MLKGNTLINNSKSDAVRIDGNVNCEAGKDSHEDFVSTPRTEASTPESGEYSIGSRDRSNSEKSVDDNFGERILQRHMSQTDDHIQLLDRNGDLDEVAGSQSMLSQELIIEHDHDENEDLGLPRGSSSKCSIGIAKRIGLLPQSQEELPQSQGEESTKSQEPLSGLDLLTQVGIKEANKISSFPDKAKSDKDINDKKSTDVSTKPNPVKSREHEGFGSLLDAVAKITEQEASQELSMDWRSTSTTTETKTTKNTEKPRKLLKKRKIVLPTSKKVVGPPPKQRKSEVQKTKERLRRERIEQENEKAQAVAKKAAMIAERTISDPVIAKKLLLSMALARENPRTVPQSLPGKGHVVQEGFFWAHYPPLELILKKHMAEYYELSTNQCQSREQQAFNNYMVGVVKDVAEKQEWAFADTFCDKSLRDRIRCYYKTHIQNAKKRLRTMVRNPTKRANARHLCEHIDLIEQHQVEKKTKESSKSTKSDRKKAAK